MNHSPAPRNIFSMPVGQELSQLVEISKTLASCPFYKNMGPGGVLAIWLTARELNLPVMMCLNGGLYTFDGKVTMSAQLMNMMIVNAGHRADVLQLDDKTCKIRFVRADRQKGSGDTFEYDFTLDMAAKAGYLHKNNWKYHTRDMLYSRCLSGGARKFMPDVLMNCYVFGEIEDANFDDSHCVNAMPAIHIQSQAEQEVIEDSSEESSSKPLELSHEKAPGYDDFIKKHKINGEKLDWVESIAKETNRTTVQMINAAMMYEDRFIKSYDSYLMNKKKDK